jgi:serine/threonine protein kinase
MGNSDGDVRRLPNPADEKQAAEAAAYLGTIPDIEERANESARIFPGRSNIAQRALFLVQPQPSPGVKTAPGHSANQVPKQSPPPPRPAGEQKPPVRRAKPVSNQPPPQRTEVEEESSELVSDSSDSGTASYQPTIVQSLKVFERRPISDKRAHLGEGGQGHVYRAVDETNGEDIAIKIPKALLVRPVKPKKVQELKEQAKLARRVASPFVARVNEFVIPTDPRVPPFLSMELVEGPRLSDWIQSGHLTPKGIFEIARDLALGLAAIYSVTTEGHGDIKPSNIKVDSSSSSFKPKIVDFGCGSAFSKNYLPPEERKRDSNDPDDQSFKSEPMVRDLWAYGITLLEMATAHTAEESRDWYADGNVVPRRFRLKDGVEKYPALEQTIRYCLRADPEARPTTVDHVLISLGVHAARQNPPDLPPPLRGLWLWVWGFVALCSLTLLMLPNLCDLRPPHSLSVAATNPGDPGRLQANAATLAASTLHVQTTQKSAAVGYEMIPGPAPMLTYWCRVSDSPLVPENPLSAVRSNDPAPTTPENVFERFDLSGPVPQLLEIWVVPAEGPFASGSGKQAVDAVAKLLADETTIAGPATPPNSEKPEITALAADGVTPSIPLPATARMFAVRVASKNASATPAAWQVVTDSTGNLVYASRRTNVPKAVVHPTALQAIAASVKRFWLPAIGVICAVFFRVFRRGKEVWYRPAKRLAAIVWSLGMLGSLLIRRQVMFIDAERLPDPVRLLAAAGAAAVPAMFVWVVYSACEPFLRRRWNSGRALLVSDRLFGGKVKGTLLPALGQSLVVGVAVGTIITVLIGFEHHLAAFLTRQFYDFGWTRPFEWMLQTSNSTGNERSSDTALLTWHDPVSQAGWIITSIAVAIEYAFALLGMFVAIGWAVRWNTPAVIAGSLVLGIPFGILMGANQVIGALVCSIAFLMLGLVLFRLGTIAAAVIMLTCMVLFNLPISSLTASQLPTVESMVGTAAVLGLLLIGLLACAAKIDPIFVGTDSSDSSRR